MIIEYSKKENGLVERANKEVTRHIRNIIFDKDVIKKWSRYIPLVRRIMNSSIHESIGVTPAQILFGNAIDLDRGIFSERNPTQAQKLSVYMADMLTAQSAIMEVARRNLQEKDKVIKFI